MTTTKFTNIDDLLEDFKKGLEQNTNRDYVNYYTGNGMFDDYITLTKFKMGFFTNGGITLEDTYFYYYKGSKKIFVFKMNADKTIEPSLQRAKTNLHAGDHEVYWSKEMIANGAKDMFTIQRSTGGKNRKRKSTKRRRISNKRKSLHKIHTKRKPVATTKKR